jgi:hypothetical protein
VTNEVTKKEEKEIFSEISSLETELAKLKEQVMLLYEDLSPIVSSPKPDVRDPAVEEGKQTPLGARLRDVRAGFSETIEQLRLLRIRILL